MNITAMLEEINRGAGASYGNFERQVLRPAVDAGKHVELSIYAVRENGSAVASKFQVRYAIDGVRGRKTFVNVRAGS